MDADKEATAQQLFERGFIAADQFAQVKAYRTLGIFSLRSELLLMLYAAVILFTSGTGILIYKNIDTIGHTVILLLLLAVCALCYYLCFKKSPGFSPEETWFEHPVYDYLVLLATILSASFIGYLQFQYRPFGDHIAVPTFLSAVIAMATAYYFDNRSALSIGITGLAAAIGITVTPKAILDGAFLNYTTLLLSGIGLGLALVLWAEYSQRTNLKRHFAIVFVTFAQHLMGVCSLTGLTGDLWPVHVLVMAGSLYYFNRKSYALESTVVFVFVLIYGYTGLNILLVRFLEAFADQMPLEILTLAAPVYFIASIVLFIRSIKQFNRNTNDSAR